MITHYYATWTFDPSQVLKYCTYWIIAKLVVVFFATPHVDAVSPTTANPWWPLLVALTFLCMTKLNEHDSMICRYLDQYWRSPGEELPFVPESTSAGLAKRNRLHGKSNDEIRGQARSNRAVQLDQLLMQRAVVSVSFAIDELRTAQWGTQDHTVISPNHYNLNQQTTDTVIVVVYATTGEICALTLLAV